MTSPPDNTQYSKTVVVVRIVLALFFISHHGQRGYQWFREDRKVSCCGVEVGLQRGRPSVYGAYIMWACEFGQPYVSKMFCVQQSSTCSQYALVQYSSVALVFYRRF